MSKRKSSRRKEDKRNSEPVTQPCCGAPKNGHYGDCPKIARNK